MMVDGARFGRVNVSNITMRGVKVPIFIRLGNRARPLPGEKKPGVGTLRDIVISNVQAAVISPVGCSITGIPGHPAENITLENIRFHFVGGGTAEQAAREVPELEGAYPKGPMFGVLPAYGFYCRHVRNLRLHNIDLDCQQRDLRPAIVCDDVQDLDLFGLRAEIDPEASGVVRLIHCRGALIHGCRAYEPIPTFLRVEGDRSEKMYLTGNDLRDAKHPVLAGPNVPKDAVEGVEVNRE